MIEAVARALFIVGGPSAHDPASWPTASPNERRYYEERARAARDAVRAELLEPSQEMVEAMRVVLRGFGSGASRLLSDAELVRIWQAGLDAALSGEVKG